MAGSRRDSGNPGEYLWGMRGLGVCPGRGDAKADPLSGPPLGSTWAALRRPEPAMCRSSSYAQLESYDEPLTSPL
eukprot:1190512-Prorocentrum_minimum.AAC.1